MACVSTWTSTGRSCSSSERPAVWTAWAPWFYSVGKQMTYRPCWVCRIGHFAKQNGGGSQQLWGSKLPKMDWFWREKRPITGGKRHGFLQWFSLTIYDALINCWNSFNSVKKKQMTYRSRWLCAAEAVWRFQNLPRWSCCRSRSSRPTTTSSPFSWRNIAASRSQWSPLPPIWCDLTWRIWSSRWGMDSKGHFCLDGM